MNGSGGSGITERRKAERIYTPFPAVVEGYSVDGEKFKVSTVLDNLCREGLYLRMVPCVEVGSTLSVIFRLSTSASEPQDLRKVSVTGQVLRVENVKGGACGIAVKFKPARFI